MEFFGFVPEDLRASIMVSDESKQTLLLIPSDDPIGTRARMLKWLADEFFPFEEEPFVHSAHYLDVATIRSIHLEKPLRITVVKREN